MQTTTREAIIDHFEGLLRTLEPTFEQERDCRWARVHDAAGAGDSEGAELRRYVVVLGKDRLTRDAYSGGEVYTFQLDIHTACGGVSSDVLAHLVDEDHLDLRRTFEAELEPGTGGFGGIFRVDDLGFEMDSTLFDDAVMHSFDIAYFRQTGLN